ncbi:ubiquitin-conjugating enzyme E2 U [Halichoerus grypus]
MQCRADFLLERDFQELKENNFKVSPGNLEGCVSLGYEFLKIFFFHSRHRERERERQKRFFPVSEDLMEWGADIEGLQNTFWHGLFFQLKINFTSQYNFVPPVVKFLTIPFHPNVDQNTGRACIDILDDPDKWNTSYTLSSILLTLQVMLSNPVLENPVNLEAAQMLIKDESLYKQEVLRLFNQPTQLRNNSPEFPKDPDKLIRSTKAISFNDYYKTWSGIATSKATEYYRSPLLEDPNFVVGYYKWKKAELKHPKEWNLK